MKNIYQYLIAIVAFLFLAGCKNETNWEYKVIYFDAQSFVASHKNYSEATDFFKNTISNTTIIPTEKSLNDLGKDGWEITTSYLETETAFPNLGNDKYVTGIQSNIRPQRLVVIFKRPIRKS
jgi:hypothetical protein